MRALAGLVALVASVMAAAALAEEGRPERSRPAASEASPLPRLHPLPPPRPRELSAAPAAAPAAEPGPDGADRAAGAACLDAFRARGGEILPVPAATAAGECAIPAPVTFRRVRRSDGSAVLLDSPVTIRCTLALELASWLREDLSAIAKRHGAELTQLNGIGGHACRMRNAQPGAPVSEHASGNAFDLQALRLADGRSIRLNAAEPGTKALREEIRNSACERFRTVLGAGSDSFHGDHLHLDMRQRSRGASLCQWLIE